MAEESDESSPFYKALVSTLTLSARYVSHPRRLLLKTAHSINIVLQYYNNNNTIQKCWTKSKRSLLQRLGEENLLETRWDLGETVVNQHNPEGPSIMMLRSTNSSCSSVENRRNQGNTPQETSLMMNPTSMGLQTRNAESLNLKCCGLPEKKKPDIVETKNVRNHGEFSSYSLGTTKSLSSGFKLPELLPWVSQRVSGITSSEDKQSTLMQCSLHCTTFQLLKRTLDAWDLLKSPSVDQNPQGRSKRVASGPAPGMRPSK